MWTMTGRPSRSPASSTASVRPSGVGTNHSISAGLGTYEPGVHVLDVILPERVPFTFEEPGFDAGDTRGQPLRVAEWCDWVSNAMQQQYRNRDPGHVEAPRRELGDAVVPESLNPRRQGELHGDRPVGGQRQVIVRARLHVQGHPTRRDRDYLLSLLLEERACRGPVVQRQPDLLDGRLTEAREPVKTLSVVRGGRSHRHHRWDQVRQECRA